MISDHYLLTKVYKETASRTMLAVSNGSKNSYVERMDAKIENSNSRSYIEDDDVLIIQLSTNDFSKGISLGNIEDEDVKDSESFDKTTITGAIEYICARARELNPDIEIAFISCPIFNSWAYWAKYKTYNDGIMQDMIQKWDINYLDLLNYEPVTSAYVSLDTSSLKGFLWWNSPKFCWIQRSNLSIISWFIDKYFIIFHFHCFYPSLFSKIFSGKDMFFSVKKFVLSLFNVNANLKRALKILNCGFSQYFSCYFVSSSDSIHSELPKNFKIAKTI